MWADEADRIEELIFYTDGAAQLTKPWPRRVASAGWRVVVFGISHDGAHRRLLGAACAPCMLEGHFSTSAPSAPAAEVTAAAAVGLLLEEGNSSAKYVTKQRCGVIANTAMANLAHGAWSAVRRLSRVETFHVRSHTGEPGNECADVLAELGRQGMRGSSSLVDRLLQCVHQRKTRKKCKSLICARSCTGVAFWTGMSGSNQRRQRRTELKAMEWFSG